jgi:AMMECR1 domain-containing protein
MQKQGCLAAAKNARLMCLNPGTRLVLSCLAISCLLAAGLNFASERPASGGEINKKLRTIPLNVIAMATLRNHFAQHPKSLDHLVKSYDLPPAYKRARGLFVTIYKGDKTRACWGSISPNHGDLVSATIFTTEGALTKEYRFSQIKAKEIDDLKAQVTVIEKIMPVGRGETLHPLTEGLMVRSNGRGAVLLPGEASDPYYQVMQCKLKAGINPKAKCQLYRIKANVIR